MYQQAQAAQEQAQSQDMGQDGGSSEAADDNVVDAEYEVVDEDDKK